jgi:hypothetical protein
MKYSFNDALNLIHVFDCMLYSTIASAEVVPNNIKILV